MQPPLLKNYVNYLERERSFSPFTVRNYAADISDFLQFLGGEGGIPPERVDRLVLRRYLASLSERGIVRASVARKLSALRSFFHYLVRERGFPSDPMTTVFPPKRERRLPSFLTEEEVSRLLEAPETPTPQGSRDRALLELLYASGLRVSEIVGLDLKDVDLKSREIRVWGKGSKERMVLIGRPAAAALAAYLLEGRPRLLGRGREQALFLNRYGRRLAERRVQLTLERYARKAGIERRVYPHLLRHTFATHMLDGGADLRVVQELLGHTSLASTQVYTHVTQSQMRRVYLQAHPRGKRGGKR